MAGGAECSSTRGAVWHLSAKKVNSTKLTTTVSSICWWVLVPRFTAEWVLEPPFNAELGNLGVWSCFVHHHGMHITRVLETAKIYCRHKRCVCVLSWRGQPKSLPNPEATIRFATCLQRRDVGTPAPTVLQNRSSKHAPPTSSCLPPLQRGTINVKEQKIGV